MVQRVLGFLSSDATPPEAARSMFSGSERASPSKGTPHTKGEHWAVYLRVCHLFSIGNKITTTCVIPKLSVFFSGISVKRSKSWAFEDKMLVVALYKVSIKLGVSETSLDSFMSISIILYPLLDLSYGNCRFC